MVDNKPLSIPDSKKLTGLKVHCYRCGTTVDKVCKQTNGPIRRCKFGSEHVFKVFAHVPGREDARKTKSLTGVRDINEARKMALEFQEEVRTSRSSTSAEIRALQDEHAMRKEKDRSLAELMSNYVGFLSGDAELVPAHKRRPRSVQHIADMKRTFLRFATITKHRGHDVRHMRIQDVDEIIIGMFYDYLTDELKLGNAAYNRAITNMVSFFNHQISEGMTSRNPFLFLVRKPMKENIHTIEQAEFDALREIMQKPELGIHTFTKEGLTKNYYRPWMRDAIELALFTGRRREELVRMKWGDVTEDGITVPDYKVIRQKGLMNKPDDWIYRLVPLTQELRALLDRLGADGREPDTYILAPHESMSRDSMRSFISKSFAHYFHLLDYPKQLKFGCLRKTYLSELSAAIGIENAQTISGHSGLNVMRKHYVSKAVLSRTASSFSVFRNVGSDLPVEEIEPEKTTKSKGKDAGRSL